VDRPGVASARARLAAVSEMEGSQTMGSVADLNTV
jgi:hypothetical protein